LKTLCHLARSPLRYRDRAKCATSSSTDASDDRVVAGAVRCLLRIASCRVVYAVRFSWYGHVIDDAMDATAFAWF
jgi:hypothetical protein